MSLFPLHEKVGPVSALELASGRAFMTVTDRVAAAFEAMRDDVFRYLLLQGLDAALAQDLTQEVFLRMHTTLSRGESIDDMRAWAFRVAHNLGVDARASDSRTLPFSAGLEATLMDRGSDPEKLLLQRERMVRLHQSVLALSPQQQQCLHLRGEGFRYREIASILGISTSTVGEFLRRAISRLRKATDE